MLAVMQGRGWALRGLLWAAFVLSCSPWLCEVFDLGGGFSFCGDLGLYGCVGTCPFGWSVKLVMLVCLSFLFFCPGSISIFCLVVFPGFGSFLVTFVICARPVGCMGSRGAPWFI